MTNKYPIPNITLDGLLKFYQEIWCQIWYELRSNNSVACYEANDQLLYKIFDKKSKYDFITKVRILDGLYSTNLGYMKEYNKEDLITILGDPLGEGDVKIKHKSTKNGTEKETSILSLVSKYQHWHQEVNEIENAVPIYDKNVREMLKGRNGGKEAKNYKELKEQIDKYIAEVIKPKEKVFAIDGKNVSIYRLVDKWLWLVYKIHTMSPAAKLINKKGGDLVADFNRLFPTT